MKELVIVGGGPAGLAAAYYAAKRNIPFKLFEASAEVGGNCRTIRVGEYLFDSGAHRIHDKSPEATALFKELLGDDMLKVNAPSAIWSDGKLFDFPLTPLDLVRKMNGQELLKAVKSFVIRHRDVNDPQSFSGRSINEYGRYISEKFLLNYTEKLWGLTADHLASEVAGARLKGLNLKTFLKELVYSRREKITHIDGNFWYPKEGIGQITKNIAKQLPAGSVCCDSPLTAIKILDNKIRSLSFNKNEIEIEGDVILSIPLNALVAMVNHNEGFSIPSVNMKFRNLILLHFPVGRMSVTEHATLYFPDSAFTFTRLTEPRNRSAFMSPSGTTSIVAEVPCFPDDEVWKMSDAELGSKIKSELNTLPFFQEEKLPQPTVIRLRSAYPVITPSAKEELRVTHSVLSGLKNAYCTGRAGTFTYSHLHDHFDEARVLIEMIGSIP